MTCQKRRMSSLRLNWQGPLGMSSAAALAGMRASPLRSALFRSDREEDGGLLLHVLALAVRALHLTRFVLAQGHHPAEVLPALLAGVLIERHRTSLPCATVPLLF